MHALTIIVPNWALYAGLGLLALNTAIQAARLVVEYAVKRVGKDGGRDSPSPPPVV